MRKLIIIFCILLFAISVNAQEIKTAPRWLKFQNYIYPVLTSDSVGIGTTTPGYKFELMSSGSVDDATIAIKRASSSDNFASRLFFLNAGGSIAAPDTISLNKLLGTINFGGYNGTSWVGGAARIDAIASQDWSTTAKGGDIRFGTTPNDSTTVRTRVVIKNSGNVGIKTMTPTQELDVNGSVIVRDTLFFNDGTSCTTLGWTETATPASHLVSKYDGLAVSSATVYGTAANTHIALGSGCITGTNGQNYGYATVSGGGSNTASGVYSTVSGGGSNTASGVYSTVSGGGLNTASGEGSTVSGGGSNTASGVYSTVYGGFNNISGGDYSFLGGANMQLTNAADRTFCFGYSSTAQSITTSDAFLIFPKGDTGSVGINTDVPDAELDVHGSVVATDSVGIGTTTPRCVLDVVDTAGVVFEGTYGDGTIPLETAGTRMMWYPAKAAFRAGRAPTDTIWNDAKIGVYSVAFGYNNVASGGLSAIFGGDTNIADGIYSICGGYKNQAMANNSVISGGSLSYNEGLNSVICGGKENTITSSGDYASISGGNQNLLSGNYSFISDGFQNIITGQYSGILSGRSNILRSDYSIASGRGMHSSPIADRTFIFGYTTVVDSVTVPDVAYFFPYGNTGKVAINTKTPTQELDVNGDAIISDTLFIADNDSAKIYYLNDTLYVWSAKNVKIGNSSLIIKEDGTVNFGESQIIHEPPHAIGTFQDSSVVISLTQDEWTTVTNGFDNLFTWTELEHFTNSGDSISTNVKHHCNVMVTLSGTGPSGDDFEFRITINGAQAPIVPKVSITSPANGAFSQCTIIGYLELETTDNVKIQVRNISDNDDITFVDGVFMTTWVHTVE